MKLSRRIARVMTPVVSLFLAAVLLELVVRLVDPRNTSFYTYEAFARPSPKPGFGSELIPGASSPSFMGFSCKGQ